MISGNIGNTLPEIDMETLQSLYLSMQELIGKGHILAGHDISE